MKKFILIISHPTDALASFEKLVTHLGRNGSRRVVPLVPHAILFEFEGDTAQAYEEAAACLGPAEQVVVFHLFVGFSGTLRLEQMERVNQFFAA